MENQNSTQLIQDDHSFILKTMQILIQFRTKTVNNLALSQISETIPVIEQFANAFEEHVNLAYRDLNHFNGILIEKEVCHE